MFIITIEELIGNNMWSSFSLQA